MDGAGWSWGDCGAEVESAEDEYWRDGRVDAQCGDGNCRLCFLR